MFTSEDFLTYISQRYDCINQALARYLPAAELEPRRLHQAMRYAVLSGGKRMRPLLVYIVGETLGADLTLLDAPACAIELIHAFSLIHDDLPAMDNDDLRRGLPTCHKQFDEATAILAGDALLVLALQLLSDNNLNAATQTKMMQVVTQASGSFGMAGGQELDMSGADFNVTRLEQMYV